MIREGHFDRITFSRNSHGMKSGEVKIVFEFDGLGDWVVYGTGDSGIFSEGVLLTILEG